MPYDKISYQVLKTYCVKLGHIIRGTIYGKCRQNKSGGVKFVKV